MIWQEDVVSEGKIEGRGAAVPPWALLASSAVQLVPVYKAGHEVRCLSQAPLGLVG